MVRTVGRGFQSVISKLRPDDPLVLRKVALRRFATALTLLNIAGHGVLGFEQSIAQPLIAVFTCYITELGLATVYARSLSRRPGYLPATDSASRGDRAKSLIDFLLPAHITGLALGMLLYIGDRLDLFVVAAVIAISSKYIFRLPQARGGQHFLNPSNAGISVVLILYSGTASIAPPYQFTENLGSFGSVALPAVLGCFGLFFNLVFTGKLPLIAAWVGGFALQGIARSAFDLGTWTSALSPLTGMALLLFTLYMVTDPGTTPRSKQGQVVFGGSVAAVYGLLVTAHVAFGVFFALTIVCVGRALLIYAAATLAGGPGEQQPVPVGRSLPASLPVRVPQQVRQALSLRKVSTASGKEAQWN